MIKKKHYIPQKLRCNFKKHMRWNIGKHKNQTKIRLMLLLAEVTVDIESKFQILFIFLVFINKSM